MLNVCDYSIVRPLCLVYKECLETGNFPMSWKNANVLPIHKKESRQLKKITGEYLCYQFTKFNYYFNKLLTPNQSGFRHGDSTVNQLLYITHLIYTAFEEYPTRETRAVFLDISKAFDKVLYDGLVFKLKTYGITGPLLLLIESYLSSRQQRVILNGKSSNWSFITAGDPQGSVLGPLFFLIYINDLVDLSSDTKLIADDTSLFTVVYDETVAADQLNRDLKVVTDWAYQWKMQFNPDINKQAVQVIFSQKRTKPIHPPLFFNDAPVVIKDEQKHLGMVLDSALNFRSHVREKIISARKGNGVIRYLSKYVSRNFLGQMYILYLRLHLDYGDIIYHKFDPELTLEFTKKLETVQYSAALAVSGAWRGTNKCELYEELGWEYLYHRRWYRRLIHFYKLKQSRLPLYLYNLIPPERELNYCLRRANTFDQTMERTNRYSNTYFQNCPKEWNRLDISVQSSQTISEFKRRLIQIVRPVN